MGQWSHTDLSQIASAPACGVGGSDFPRPAGCVRPDRTNAVFFTGKDDRHIHQLHLSAGTWVHTDLSQAANAPLRAETSPAVCVRPDKVVSIAYTAQGGHIHAVQIGADGVTHADLSEAATAPRASLVGPPTHLVRGDGVVAVIHMGFPTSAIHQLALNGAKWVHSNLSDLAQSGAAFPLLKIAGYVRGDKTTAAIHMREGVLMELALPPNGNWTGSDLFRSLHAPKPHHFHWPTGFVRADGTPSVVYADNEGFVHELALVAGKWGASALSESANAPTVGLGGPMGYVRGDGITAVVYSGKDQHIHELALVEGRWLHTDLSLAANTSTTGYPFAYVRSDGVSSVIYKGSDNHVHELALPPG